MCQPLKKNDIKFLSQKQDCTVEIPVKFLLENETVLGFLKPDTLEIVPSGTLGSCSNSRRVVFSWFKITTVYIQDRETIDISTSHGSPDDFNNLVPRRTF